MTTVVISQPMLFPWVGMFEQIALADVYVHYDDVQFSKGSFTNRVQLRTDAGMAWLTIPLRDRGSGRLIKDLEPADGIDWRADHRRVLEAAYRKAPHATTMLELVDECYRDHRSLAEVLMSSMERVARRHLDLADRPEFARSSTLGIEGSSWARVLDVVRSFGGDTYVTGHGAQRYLDAQAFEDAGVEVRYMDYACRPYPQGAPDFTPYVSVLDLLANTGPSASTYLEPRTVHWRDFDGGAVASE